MGTAANIESNKPRVIINESVLPEDGDTPEPVKTKTAPKHEPRSIDMKKARHLLASHSHRMSGIQKFSASPDVSALRTQKKETRQEPTDSHAPIKLKPELQKLFGSSHSHARTKLGHHMRMNIGQATVMKPRLVSSNDAPKRLETLGQKPNAKTAEGEFKKLVPQFKFENKGDSMQIGSHLFVDPRHEGEVTFGKGKVVENNLFIWGGGSPEDLKKAERFAQAAGYTKVTGADSEGHRVIGWYK